MIFTLLNDMSLFKEHKHIIKENDIIIIKPEHFENKSKILGLDFDHTIVKPKNGNTFSKNINDWEWLYPCVPYVIKDYYYQGYSIVIFTNQVRSFKIEQIYNVMNRLYIPYKAYIGIKKIYKKPCKCMFDLLNNESNEIDYTNSIYIGDALGRKNDWSNVDLKFAKRCGLNYKSPEEFYDKNNDKTIIKHPYKFIEEQELVLMVGYPASGKTTYTKLYESKQEIKKNYVVLHGDKLKTESKIKNRLKELLKIGKSVVIDATNPSIKKRKTFIYTARQINPNIKTRIIHFTGDISECMERNNKRENKVPNIALYMYRKNYQQPTSEEVDIIDTYHL